VSAGSAPGFILEVVASKYRSNCSVSLVMVGLSPNLTAIVKAREARYLRGRQGVLEWNRKEIA
jgi:hypothetical protein